jgi:hypothetical protein
MNRLDTIEGGVANDVQLFARGFTTLVDSTELSSWQMHVVDHVLEEDGFPGIDFRICEGKLECTWHDTPIGRTGFFEEFCWPDCECEPSLKSSGDYSVTVPEGIIANFVLAQITLGGSFEEATHGPFPDGGRFIWHGLQRVLYVPNELNSYTEQGLYQLSDEEVDGLNGALVGTDFS